jgi:phospholipid/cholesterol/gamma-HCH transport system ATP-binding protein
VAQKKWQPPDEDAAQPSDQWHIRVRGVNKTFGPHHVLRGVDLDVARGKINVIIGGSGQGKSVIMKHLMGLLKPDTGTIYVDGEDIVPLDDFGLNRVRKKFGMLFQYAALFDSLTVEENIVFPLVEHGDPDTPNSGGVGEGGTDPRTGRPRKRRRFSRAELHQIAVDQLDKLSLPQVLIRKFPSELSGGQRKRVGLARALVMKPKILLYDEPTTGLDPVSTKNVDDMIRDVSRDHGVTSVIISHDMASTFRIGDRISALYNGVIIESGSPDEIRGTRHRWLREFIGTSGAVQLDPVDEADLIVDDPT